MPKILTDQQQRKVSVSFTLRDVVRQFVLAEAEKTNRSLSLTAEDLIVAGLEAAGYPTFLLRPDNEDSGVTERKETVLTEYARAGNITEASRKAGVSLASIYRWASEDRSFADGLSEIKRRKGGRGQAHRSPLDGYSEAVQSRRGGRPVIRELPARGDETVT